MLVEVIFLILFGAAWSLVSVVSWIACSLPRRARGALWAAPFAELGGIGGGVLPPLAGLDDGLGLGVSMATALAGSATTCWLSYRVWDAFSLGDRFARWARQARSQRRER